MTNVSLWPCIRSRHTDSFPAVCCSHFVLGSPHTAPLFHTAIARVLLTLRVRSPHTAPLSWDKVRWAGIRVAESVVMDSRAFRKWLRTVWILTALLCISSTVRAQSLEGICSATELGTACADGGTVSPDAAVFLAPTSARSAGATTLTVFWGLGCTHCERARPEVLRIAEELDARIEWVEVRANAEGRARFEAVTQRLGITSPGVPFFVVGDRAVVGFREREVRALLEGRALEDPLRGVDLPFFGRVNPSQMSLPLFTVLVGLADGFNPCAFYVLLVLLSVLLHAKSRTRMALYGGLFVVSSAVVYFLFMTAWLGVFLVTGMARWATLALGALLVAMGLVNLKELVWFKEGVSLMIPDSAKPGLFRRMREVASSASTFTAVVGIGSLALLVNLVELGCTLGLPAMFTRVLSLRTDLSSVSRVGYLALYNVAYVVPLALIVLVYVATMHRFTMTERGAKILKALSGGLLLLFGLLFLFKPELLQ